MTQQFTVEKDQRIHDEWEEVGKIKRYTEEDIIEKAEEFLSRGKL